MFRWGDHTQIKLTSSTVSEWPMNKMLPLLSDAGDITWSTPWRHTPPPAPCNTSVTGNSGCGDALIESRTEEPLGRVHLYHTRKTHTHTHTHGNCICFNNILELWGHLSDFFLTKRTQSHWKQQITGKVGELTATDWMCEPITKKQSFMFDLNSIAFLFWSAVLR